VVAHNRRGRRLCTQARGGGTGAEEQLTCTMQQQGRPRLAAAADGYRYLREGAIREPGRPGPGVERCPHDLHRVAEVASAGDHVAPASHAGGRGGRRARGGGRRARGGARIAACIQKNASTLVD
jgi:hypothetical protein